MKLSSVPLMCWDIIAMDQTWLTQKTQRQKEKEALLDLSKKRRWLLDGSILDDKDYQALVLTDSQKHIIWVNDGFKLMTGYSKKFAIGKNPKFLQGIDTLDSSRNSIRDKLKSGKPFSEQILNYKKDGSAYMCEITIYPLLNKYHETKAFLALEKEIQ
ncbi:PAS domain-containing protein [Peijinzhouia sedimentorum]